MSQSINPFFVDVLQIVFSRLVTRVVCKDKGGFFVFFSLGSFIIRKSRITNQKPLLQRFFSVQS